MVRARALGAGLAAALRSPLWITRSGLKELRQATPDRIPARPYPDRAVRISAQAIRVLAWVPFLPWRNTCLYRSVAECLVLRSSGVGCRLELGVSRAGTGADGIVAHAWVERTGRPSADHPHVSLRSPS
jgi:hypothetical protein